MDYVFVSLSYFINLWIDSYSSLMTKTKLDMMEIINEHNLVNENRFV